ncbi:MAG TPA: MDR family oxidoreductase [Chthonomonadaceae bacterium]|nr:MDR family oxidoreductase [Chthonomonadaceae bacterium]
MPDQTFRAILIEKGEAGDKASLQELPTTVLPEGDVLVAVAYSSLNYKDGLAVTGKGRVVRNYPMVPGIDLAGTVQESQSLDYRPGDKVILTGWGIGEQHWGGYAQVARVRSEWLVQLPEGLSLQEAMGIGTAGFTAMLSVMTLEEHGRRPEDGEVAVTGAAGGVGSIAIALLAQRGYRVVASTGRTELHDYLTALGAQEIIGREVLPAPGRPLESGRWSGAVDTVGGDTLAGLLRSMKLHGCVAACGLAGGSDLNTTVFPFILRGVGLLGIDSNWCPQARRREAWARLANDLPKDHLARMMQVVPLPDVLSLSREILQGHVRGRIVVDVNA